jgi:hypothetical protein
MADANEDGLENDHFETHEEDEESLIRYYFYRGFDYKEIVLFLLQNHDIQMSMATFNDDCEGTDLGGSYQNMTLTKRGHPFKVLLMVLDVCKDTGPYGIHCSLEELEYRVLLYNNF